MTNSVTTLVSQIAGMAGLFAVYQDGSGNSADVLPNVSNVATAIGNNPAGVVAALITAGVLKYVSDSSGPLQFTTTAVANVQAPAVVNISDQTEIDIDNHHHHHR